jgi:2-iminobutanoate/2-iminopropanoate deaminase
MATMPEAEALGVGDFAERGDRFALTAVHGLEAGETTSPERQFAVAFARMTKRLAAEGLGPEAVGRVTVFIPDPSFRPFINEPWLALFPDDADRPARKTTHIPLAGECVVELSVEGVRGAARSSLEIEGVSHKDPLPMGARLGRYVFSSVISADIPGGGRATRVDAVRQAFKNAEALMAAAGGSLADVQNVWTYFGMWDLHPEMVDLWVEAFPDEAARPSRKTFYYPGVSCQLEIEGVLGGQRSALEISGLSHHDPIPMGTVGSGVLTTSGVDGRDPVVNDVPRGVRAQTRQAIANLRALVANGGQEMDDLVQVSGLLGELDYAAEFTKVWAEEFPDRSAAPALQLMTLGLPARDVLVQVIAQGIHPVGDETNG